MYNINLVTTNKNKLCFKKITVLSALLTLSACNTSIKNLPKISEIPTPETWQVDIEPEIKAENKNKENAQFETINSKTVATQNIENAWLKNFKDPALDKYVAKAIQNNPNLLSVAAQLKSAVKQINITGASLWPIVSSNLHSNRTTVEGQVLSPTNSINDNDGVDDGVDGVNLDGLGQEDD